MPGESIQNDNGTENKNVDGSQLRSQGLESQSGSAFAWALMGVTAHPLEDVTPEAIVKVASELLEQEAPPSLEL